VYLFSVTINLKYVIMVFNQIISGRAENPIRIVVYVREQSC